MDLKVDELFPGIGVNAKVHHAGIMTASGKMEEGSALIQKLGFKELKPRRKQGGWGRARFYKAPGSSIIQLTESTEFELTQETENHLAIETDNDPEAAANGIVEWCKSLGFNKAKVSKVGPGKYWITALEILSIPVEIMSSYWE